MTIDDNSLLSAYMDGQLSPDHQQLVESALIADPQLGEDLRSLCIVRDLVAGLSHDASVDVSAGVLRRLHSKSRLARLWAVMPVRAPSLPPPAWAAGMLGVAAAILIVGMLTFFSIGLPPADRGPAEATGLMVASPDNILTSPTDLLEASESRWPLFAHSTSLEGATSKSETEDRHREDHHRSASESNELEHVSQYLDNPDLRRIFLVAGVTDEATQKQVATVVEETTRFNYLKITIAQGIVIDPRHPDEATVFALVVNPNELETLRNRLRTVLHDRVEEAPVDPTVVTQLADVGQVRACRPAPVADVEIPRVALAKVFPNEGGGDEPVAPVDPPKPDRSPIPTPFQERSSPAAEPATRGPDQSCIVLVWVSRARPG